MFWISLILFLLFLTPIGWIGMICLGACVAQIVEAKNKDYYDMGRSNLIYDLKSRCGSDTPEEVKDYINGL